MYLILNCNSPVHLLVSVWISVLAWTFYTLLVKEILRNTRVCVKLNRISPTPKPSYKPVRHGCNVRQSTCIWMHQQREDKCAVFRLRSSMVPQPEEDVLPALLDNTGIYLSIGVGHIREILQCHHVFVVPANRDLDEGVSRWDVHAAKGRWPQPAACGLGEVDAANGRVARGEVWLGVVMDLNSSRIRIQIP